MLQILISKKFINTDGITTHPIHKSYRRHIGTLTTSDWEPGLREATYQALLRENNREPTLRDQIYYAPLEGRQDTAIPFGDIIVLARGQFYSTYNGFKFVQDPYQNDCDDCHNGRVRCSPSQCKGWNPVTGEQLVALWTVKRIRHRDPSYGHRYELEFTVSPISAVINTGFLLPDGGFDYNIPGHVFIIKTDVNVEKSTDFYKATTAAFDHSGTRFSNNYVRDVGTKMPTQNGAEKEVDLYKELIHSLAMKTSTSLKPLVTSPVYSEIFDATIQKIPVTMIHQQTSVTPAQITSIWSTTPEIKQSTTTIKFPSTQSSTTRYSEVDPLYHSTIPTKKVQQTSKPPITTITFFAPDDSVTENEIFGSTHRLNKMQIITNGVTTGTEHADIFDVAEETSTINLTTENSQVTSTKQYSSSAVPVTISEETTVIPTTVKPKITTFGYGSRKTSKLTRRTRKPFIPNRFTKTSTTVRTTQKLRPTRRKTTTSLEFDEVFLQTTTPKTSTTEKVTQTTKNTIPSIFDVSLEENSEELQESQRTTPATQTTSDELESTTENKATSTNEESEEDLIAQAKTESTQKMITIRTDATTPYNEKYTTIMPSTIENISTLLTLETDKTTNSANTAIETETTTFVANTEKSIATTTTPTTQTKPIVFVGTIVTRRPTTTQRAKNGEKPTKNGDHKDVFDIFGEDATSVLEKPTTEKQSTIHVADDFLFGSEVKRLPSTTQGALVIFDNFFEASTSNPGKSVKNFTTTTPFTTQLENNTEETKTEAEALTSMSYITSISFEVNGKNMTNKSNNATEFQPMVKATMKEIATNTNDFKVFKAEMPEAVNEKQQFDHVALSLINHARTIDILNNNKTRSAKYKRRSYPARRGRKRKVRREKTM